MNLFLDILFIIVTTVFGISTIISMRNGSTGRWANDLKAKAAKKGIYTHKH